MPSSALSSEPMNQGESEAPHYQSQARVPIQRTRQQEIARVEKAKLSRRPPMTIPTSTERKTDKDNAPQSANNNETIQDDTRIQAAQDRVNRIRFLKAQVVLGSEEETNNQIEHEERQKPSMLRYSPALAAAALKDGLDFIGIGSLPVIGTIVTFFCSVLVFLFLVLAKKNGSLTDMKFVIRRLLVILVTFLAEGILFGVNLLPLETAAVLIVFFLDKRLSESQIAVLQNLAGGLKKKPL